MSRPVDGARALALIDRALERNGEGQTRDYLLGEILSGRATVFAGERAVMVCTLHENLDGSREVHVWLGAGDLRELTGDLREWAEAWAKSNGATVATIDGRKGWSRAAPGFEDDTGALRKVL